MIILMMAKILTNLSLYYAFVSLFRGNASLLPVALSIIFCMAGVGTAVKGKEEKEAREREDAELYAARGADWNAATGAEALKGAVLHSEAPKNALASVARKILSPTLLKLISFLLLALPFLLLRPFANRQVGTGILCLIPAVYCAVLIVMGNLRVEYNRFEVHLRISAIVFLILFAMIALFSASWQTSAAFTVLYLYSGTWLLRQLRLQEGSDSRVRILDALISAGILLAVYLAGGVLLFLLGYAVNFLDIIVIPIEAILYVLAWIFYTLVSLLPGISGELPQEMLEQESMAEGEMAVQQYGSKQSGNTLLILLAVIAAVIVVKFIIHLIRKYQYREKPEAMDEKTIRREKIARPVKNRHLVGGDNRNTVRKLYRKYLKKLKADGMEVSPGMTSEDVLSAAEKIHGTGAYKTENPDFLLRKIYMKVRYKQNYISDEKEVQAAKEVTRHM